MICKRGIDGGRPMKVHLLVMIASASALAACASQQQLVDEMKPQAVETAQKKGSFEMNCPAATAQVLSDEMIQQRATYGPYAGMPPERAEYTVGVQGCGQRTTYTVVCAHGGTGCIAANSQGNEPVAR
jgi:hypothetical protein